MAGVFYCCFFYFSKLAFLQFQAILTAAQFLNQFVQDIRLAGIPEWVAVVSGIVSVYFSRKENVLVYPSGLLNTILYVYLSFSQHLLGEATVNFYYTVMSLYGWWQWSRKNQQQQVLLHITGSDKRFWLLQLAFFAFCYTAMYAALVYLQANFYPGAIPWADAFASATAFTGMWLMTRKKVESWYWWIATNLASVPLYFVKHFALTSVYYLILLFMAFQGLQEWKRKEHLSTQPFSV